MKKEYSKPEMRINLISDSERVETAKCKHDRADWCAYPDDKD